ncbi:MAG: dUTP diphosphatase [Pseudomonadota bacterium]|nr:dUTP diphosphatase [Pseudomonadota bacterium]MEC8128785.1 dUTP diphosphatase [Pseudomonadota bacterium]
MTGQPSPTIQLRTLAHFDGLDLPAYATDGAAGMDVQAAVEDQTILAPGERLAVPTGLAMAIPAGFEVQVRPRSGLALRHGLTIANAPGTIDSDYRGEVKIMLINLGKEEVAISRGMRIAQLVVAPVSRAGLALVDSLRSTDRGSGGFGSTGL